MCHMNGSSLILYYSNPQGWFHPSHYNTICSSIAVVSMVLKVLEKIVITQLSSYLEENQLFIS